MNPHRKELFAVALPVDLTEGFDLLELKLGQPSMRGVQGNSESLGPRVGFIAKPTLCRNEPPMTMGETGNDVKGTE